MGSIIAREEAHLGATLLGRDNGGKVGMEIGIGRWIPGMWLGKKEVKGTQDHQRVKEDRGLSETRGP